MLTIPADSVRLFAKYHPATLPFRLTSIVFLHGFSLDSRIWEGQKAIAECISGGATLVFVDARGHGRSPAPPTGYSRAHRVADLIATLDHLEINQAHLVGHSMGGSTALGAALDFPERVASLTLVATGAAGWKNGGWIDDLFRRAQTISPQEIHQEWIEKSVKYFSTPERAHVGELMARIMRDNPGVIWSDPMRGRYPAVTPDLERMKEVRCPVLILAGEQDKKFVALAKALHAESTESRLEILPDAGHMLSLESPDRLNELVAQHVSSTLAGRTR